MSGIFSNFGPRWRFLQISFVIILLVCIFPEARSQSIVGRISRPWLNAKEMAVYEGGDKLCVFDEFKEDNDTLLIYDLNSYKLLKKIHLKRFWNSWCKMTVDEKTGKLYVGVRDNVYTIELNNDFKLTSTGWDFGMDFVRDIEIDAEKRRVYVLYQTFLLVINTDTDQYQSIQFPSLGSREALCLNTTTHEVLITNIHKSLIDVVNPETLTIGQVNGEKGWDIEIDSKRNTIYITTVYWGGIWVLNRNNNESKFLGPVADYTNLQYSEETDKIYTSAEVDNKSIIIDCKTQETMLLPMLSFPGYQFVKSTKHAYYPNDYFMAVLDQETIGFHFLPFPNAGLTYSTKYCQAVSQKTGKVIYSVNNSEEGEIIIVQDEENLTHPALYFGMDPPGRIYLLNCESLTYIDNWISATSGNTFAFLPASDKFYSWRNVYLGTGNWPKLLQLPTQVANIAVSPDGTKAFATEKYADLINVYSTQTNELTTTIPTGDYPMGIAITSDGSRILVTNQKDNTLSIIDGAGYQNIKTIAAGKSPLRVAVNQAATKAYVTNSASNSVSVVDLATNSNIKTIEVGIVPEALAFTNDNKYVYVANRYNIYTTPREGTISVIDAGKDEVIKTITAGYDPRAVSPYPFRDLMAIGTKQNLFFINTIDFSITKIPWYDKLGWEANIMAVGSPDPSSKIAGRVVSNMGTPLAGVTVTARKDGIVKGTAATNESGDYCISRLGNGNFDVEFKYPDNHNEIFNNQLLTKGRTILIPPGSTTGLDNGYHTDEANLLVYPNPFNSFARIEYTIPQPGKVELSIQNLTSQKIQILTNEFHNSGQYSIEVSGTDLPGGIYFIKMLYNKTIFCKKLVLVK